MKAMALKFFLGGLITVAIGLVAQTRLYFLSGLIPLFPTFGLISSIVVYNTKGPLGLKETAVFGLYSLIPYGAYLLTILLTAQKYSFPIVIGLSLLAWSISALLIFYFYQEGIC
jgi:membrane protein GlpM